MCKFCDLATKAIKYEGINYICKLHSDVYALYFTYLVECIGNNGKEKDVIFLEVKNNKTKEYYEYLFKYCPLCLTKVSKLYKSR